MDTQMEPLSAADAAELKSCCAALYQSDWARLLLGESFHPGGLALTERLGALLELGPGKRLLDVAAGQGASALFLARRFGCEVVGVEYGSESVRKANAAAEAAGVAHLVHFQQGDAERLPVEDERFDAVICECAFCTFPHKRAAAAEFSRVLRPGGRVGLSDLTRAGAVPPSLQGLLAWIACIADAQPLERYVQYLADASLRVDLTEAHDGALSSLVQDIRTRLLGAELLVKLKKIDLPAADFEQAKTLARAAADAVKQGNFGYAIVTAVK
ncbi:MAG TPA: methyltransferase domain-containing protein [Ktedonobacterales bacterium]|nr:methyltransferase domain-containing protein [Ktedonobacterales bacterium]